MRRLLFVITTMFLMVQGASAWNGSGSSGDPYLIASTADWNTLASNVANGNTYSNTYFKLTADITVTTMVNGTFSGTFDGAGYTLTFTYTSTANNAAPFAHLNGGTIKNLRTAGTITAKHKFAAGIVAQTDGGTNNITNCWSSVTIDSSVSGDGTHGGLVGHNPTGTLNITNCLFDGKLLGANTQACGGIVGYRTGGSSVYIKNSLFAPAEVTIKTSGTTSGCAMFTRNGCDASTSYYKTTWAPDVTQGNNANSMTAEALVTALNNGNKNWCIHRGNAIPIMVNLVISTKAQWDTFAANNNDYIGKYVQLGANIGTANTPVTAMKSGEFKGVFDGNGHTLTVNLTNSGGNVAPFYYLYGGTIMNLTVSGGVTTAGSFNAGLVARTHGGINYIQNCIIHTNVAVGDYGGGVVGHADNASSLTISDCIYDGTITHTGSYAGGILGWYNNDKTLDLVMTNCLFKGDYTGNGQFHPIGVKKWAGIFKSINCTNCYYTKNPANIDDAKRTFTDGTKVCELSLGDNIIATGSSCTFDGKTYHLGTVSLSYTPSKPTLFYMIDGNEISGNSFTISKDNQAFDAGAVTITAGDTSITYHYGGTNNTILYIDVNNGNSNMVTHPWTSEANYSSITSVVIGNGVTSICGKAFLQCPNLTSVSIPSSVTSIGDYTFSGCTGLTSIEIPASVTSIGMRAFQNCSNLATVTVYAPSCSLVGFAFDGCTKLTNIYVLSDKVSQYKTTWSAYAEKISVMFDGTSTTTVNFDNDVTVNGVLYNRTFTASKPSTVMLPFSKAVGDISGGTFYTFGGVQKENDKWVATMNEVTGSIEANTPYLFMPAGTSMTFTGGATLNTTDGGGKETADQGSHWTFKGTYEYKEWISGGANAEEIGKAYGFAGVAKTGIEVGDFVKVASGAKIRPMGCYLLWSDTPNASRAAARGAATEELPQSITVRLVSADGEVTGIGEIDTKTGEMTFDSEAWYTLNGVRLSGKPTKKGLYINNGKKVVIK